MGNIPFLTNIDLNKNQLLNTVLQNLSAAPNAPSKGQIYFDLGSNTLKVWNGTQWLDGGTGELPALVISNVAGLQAALDGKVANSRVLTDVPTGAKFTDTVYAHPANHPASMITQTATARFVSDAEKAVWDAKVETVNGKTGKAILYAEDILMLSGGEGSIADAVNSNINNIDVLISGKANLSYVNAELDKKETPAAAQAKATAALNAAKSHTDTRVKTDVPSSAIFTDTVTTINGKTGTINKADIVALGIPATDTNTTYGIATISANGLMSAPDKTKLDGIASKANNYSHPTGDGNLHVPATGTANNGKILKAGATAGSLSWGTDNDTITTINGKTGAIVKADIVALGIPAQDTTYTKASLDLGNVDNTADLAKPISTAQQNALNLKENISVVDTKVSTAENNAKAYADTKIASLLGTGTSEALDTLKELAEALGNDPNFATTMMMQLSAKTEQVIQTIGNGTLTSFDVSHNMGHRDVIVQVRQTGSPFAVVYTDIEMLNNDVVRIKFSQPPTTNEYTVVVIGSRIPAIPH